MKRKKMICVLVIGLAIIVLSAIILIIIKRSNNNSDEMLENTILLRYGDNFSSVTCEPIEGNKDTIINELKYNIVFYIDPYCESCLKSFVAADHMNKILGKYVDVTLLWRQEPSEDIINKVGIDKDKQFVLNNVKISNPYPTYFVIDKKGEIVLSVDDLDKVTKNIVVLDCFTKENIITSANQYFFNKVGKENNKPALIYFAMEGCNDCAVAEKMLNAKNIQDKYNLLTVYTEESYGEQEIVDVGSLFLEIYGIEWYPSFLIIKDDTYQFVGETSIEELENILMVDN